MFDYKYGVSSNVSSEGSPYSQSLQHYYCHCFLQYRTLCVTCSCNIELFDHCNLLSKDEKSSSHWLFLISVPFQKLHYLHHGTMFAQKNYSRRTLQSCKTKPFRIYSKSWQWHVHLWNCMTTRSLSPNKCCYKKSKLWICTVWLITDIMKKLVILLIDW